MEKATKRYNTKVEIPISIILDTVFSNYNDDVELLCRQAFKYGFVDFDDKTNEYVLQKDYKEQDLYIDLDKEERKQHDFENKLIEKGKKLEKEYICLQQENQKLKNDNASIKKQMNTYRKRYKDLKETFDAEISQASKDFIELSEKDQKAILNLINFKNLINDGNRNYWKNLCAKKSAVIYCLEHWLKEKYDEIESPDMWYETIRDTIQEVQNKLQELKVEYDIR